MNTMRKVVQLSVLAILAVLPSCTPTDMVAEAAVETGNGEVLPVGHLDDSGIVSASAGTVTAMHFPTMPPKIKGMLHQNWDLLDPEGDRMISILGEIDGIVEFSHARSTFQEHLKGTFGILAAWDQPSAVRRAGLVHTGYSGDLFQFYLFDAHDERDLLASIIGEEAEDLVFQFGTINRGQLCNFHNVLNRTHPHLHSPTPIEGPQLVTHRILGQHNVTERDAAHILMVTIADYLDQMVETNGWRDHHMIDVPDHLFPGDGRPAVALYWMSSVCNNIRPHLDTIPPVFDHCQVLLTYEDEYKARELYWQVVTEEVSLSEEQQIQLLQEAVQLNPHVGEPHIMLSQLFYRQGQYQTAALHAAEALTQLYTLAAAWDKRRDYSTWIGFARICLYRANRRAKSLTPFEYTDVKSATGIPLVSIRNLVSEMQ